MNLLLLEPSLVVLVGPAGSGKSTFARRHFRPTEVLSSDFFRGLVSDDENDQSASRDAFELLHLAAAKRLARRLLTVIDATNVRREARKQLLDLAKRHNCPAVAVVFNFSEETCRTHDEQRTDRKVGPDVIRYHAEQLRLSLGGIETEGFQRVHVLASPEEAAAAVVEREPPALDRRVERGPFDIIGDVHGCCEELVSLLGQLGYEVATTTDTEGRPDFTVTPPAGRKAVFVGDLVDRGPDSPGVLRLVMGMAAAGNALCVVGNHDDKLMRYLKGRDVRISHGLARTLEQLAAESEAFRDRVRAFLDGLVTHYLLDGSRLVVAHAGLPEELQGRTLRRARTFALYGETTGETDEAGLPVRLNWAANYRGAARVVYGHTPVVSPGWLNGTINIDTGCVFGGRLTALRWPEDELVSVPSLRLYCEPPLPSEGVPQTSPDHPAKGGCEGAAGGMG